MRDWFDRFAESWTKRLERLEVASMAPLSDFIVKAWIDIQNECVPALDLKDEAAWRVQLSGIGLRRVGLNEEWFSISKYGTLEEIIEELKTFQGLIEAEEYHYRLFNELTKEIIPGEALGGCLPTT